MKAGLLATLQSRGFRRTVKTAFVICITLLSVVGAYSLYHLWAYNSVREKVAVLDKGHKVYDQDFKYQVPEGVPIVRTAPERKTTVFLIGGFRAAHFLEYFNELYEKEGVNVVAPIVGLSSWPFEMRNREWFYEEDMRTIVQMYDMYTANLPASHRVVVVSFSFGALGNTTIGVRAKRAPDAMIYLSPLNTHLEYRAASPVMAWLAGKMEYVRHVIPMIVRTQNKSRAGLWDVVNDQKNLAAWNAYGLRVVNWEENLTQALEVRKGARFNEESMIPRLKGRNVIILNGDDDLFFSQKGFGLLADGFRKAGNNVSHRVLPKTGHMVLNDNGADEAKRIISDVLKNRYIVAR